MKKHPLVILPILVLGLSVLANAESPPAPAAPAASTPAQTTAQAKPVTSSSTSGKITAYTAGSHGELDGFILDSGTTVHFPVHTGFKIKPLLKKGEVLAVEGTIQAGPVGQVLEAATIKNTVSGQSVNVASILPPGALPPGAVSPPGMPTLNQAPNS